MFSTIFSFKFGKGALCIESRGSCPVDLTAPKSVNIYIFTNIYVNRFSYCNVGSCLGVCVLLLVIILRLVEGNSGAVFAVLFCVYVLLWCVDV